MAETELSVLSRQCLSRRISDIETIDENIAAWEHARNTAKTTIDWQFTASDARPMLRRLNKPFAVLLSQRAVLTS